MTNLRLAPGVLLLLAGAVSVAATARDRPDPRPAAPARAEAATRPGATLTESRRVRLVTAPDGNRARFRVREQLAGFEFPNDAVGETTNVTGALVLDDGRVVRDSSRFVVDLTTLESDSDRRDRYIQRRTLETAEYPTAVFVPTAVRGLPTPLPASGELTLELEGELTLHGTTKPVVWQVTARAADGAFTGTATTQFTFGDFGMTIPRVGRVLSIRDEIRLEYEFRLVPDRSGATGDGG